MGHNQSEYTTREKRGSLEGTRFKTGRRPAAEASNNNTDAATPKVIYHILCSEFVDISTQSFLLSAALLSHISNCLAERDSTRH